MWLKDEVDDSLLEEVNRRLREYTITQMSNFLRFLLAVTDITDSGTKTFDEVCVEEYDKFIKTTTYADENEYSHDDYIPYFNCLWDIIFNLFGWYYERVSYTPIFSAYCRSNNIATKKELYVKMSAELESWIDTINRLEDIGIIAIGLSHKIEINEAFVYYDRNKSTNNTKWYKSVLDILIKNNFENIDLDSYEMKPIEPIKTKYDDPHQQVFYKYIMLRIHALQTNLSFKTTTKMACATLSCIIDNMFHVKIPIHLLDENIKINNIELNNIDQIIEYLESKIPQYPDEIKDHLSILTSSDLFIQPEYKHAMANLAKMAELSKYNLRNLPIEAIINGFYGATPLMDIPLEQIPEYYARLTQSYNNTKPARR